MQNKMIRELYQKLQNNQELRPTLGELRKLCKDYSHRHALLYCIGDDYRLFHELLNNEDAKVRKNTALLIGELGIQAMVDMLYQCYRAEQMLFVKPSYLTAMKELNFIKYLPDFKERLHELSKAEFTVEEKKHRSEEMRELSTLIVMAEGIKKHEFTGYSMEQDLILLTNRNHIDITLNQLSSESKKAFGAGVMVKTNQLKEVLPIRTYTELLFAVPGMLKAGNDPIEIAKVIDKAGLVKFLKQRHSGTPPYYFRIEYKTKLPLDKKSAFTKKLAQEIENNTMREMVNSPSDYEIELRLIEGKDGNINLLLKLYTLPDHRFDYRLQSIATSIRPVNAALTVALAKSYMKEQAQVLDPFCGVGTMLIERHKAVKANTTYGIDCYEEAIKLAKANTEAAHQLIHYINKDFFEFTHDYLFDEIITDMPFAMGKTNQANIVQIYDRFFDKSREVLKEEAVMILYTHDRELVKKGARKYAYQIEKEYEISAVEGTYVVVLNR